MLQHAESLLFLDLNDGLTDNRQNLISTFLNLLSRKS